MNGLLRWQPSSRSETAFVLRISPNHDCHVLPGVHRHNVIVSPCLPSQQDWKTTNILGQYASLNRRCLLVCQPLNGNTMVFVKTGLSYVPVWTLRFSISIGPKYRFSQNIKPSSLIACSNLGRRTRHPVIFRGVDHNHFCCHPTIWHCTVELPAAS